MDSNTEHDAKIIGSRGMTTQSISEVLVQKNTLPVSKNRRPTNRKASAKVKGGRVTKAKTEGSRKSSRIANRKNLAEKIAVENFVPISRRKATRKVAIKKAVVKTESKKTAVSTTKKVVKKKAPGSKRNVKNSPIAKKPKSGWANAVEIPDSAAIERASIARSSRAARRSAGSTRRTRSQTVL